MPNITASNGVVTPRWVLYRSVGYMCGKGIIFGGPQPQVIANGKGVMFYNPEARQPNVFAVECGDVPGSGAHLVQPSMDGLMDGMWNYVILGPSIPPTAQSINDARGKLRHDGHLVLIDTKPLITPSGHWKLKEQIINRDGVWLAVYKKLRGHANRIEPMRTVSKPKACIARYGALGDMIMITPVIKQLALDGYDVTLNVSTYGEAVFENNPYISNIVLQERNLIPNGAGLAELDPYWAEWSAYYDKYINLSGSVEQSLLKIEGRRDFYWPKSLRNAECATKNYFDHTMKCAGYPDVIGTRGEIFLSKDELEWARKVRGQYDGKFVIAWNLRGSSDHKIYPMAETVAYEFGKDKHDVAVLTVGNENEKYLDFELPWADSQLGKLSVREAIALVHDVADLVVGPESFIMNVAGCTAVPKIALLSHSSAENFTKYFLNCKTMEPDQRAVPCYPCNQLHYNHVGPSCPISEARDADTGEVMGAAPLCAMQGVSIDRMLDALNQTYKDWKERKNASS